MRIHAILTWNRDLSHQLLGTAIQVFPNRTSLGKVRITLRGPLWASPYTNTLLANFKATPKRSNWFYRVGIQSSNAPLAKYFGPQGLCLFHHTLPISLPDEFLVLKHGRQKLSMRNGVGSRHPGIIQKRHRKRTKSLARQDVRRWFAGSSCCVWRP